MPCSSTRFLCLLVLFKGFRFEILGFLDLGFGVSRGVGAEELRGSRAVRVVVVLVVSSS